MQNTAEIPTIHTSALIKRRTRRTKGVNSSCKSSFVVHVLFKEWKKHATFFVPTLKRTMTVVNITVISCLTILLASTVDFPAPTEDIEICATKYYALNSHSHLEDFIFDGRFGEVPSVTWDGIRDFTSERCWATLLLPPRRMVFTSDNGRVALLRDRGGREWGLLSW